MPNQYEYSLAFFERWYRADNAVLVVAGDVVPERVFELARHFYSAWRPGVASLQTPVEPVQTEERVAHIRWPAPTLPVLAMAFHTPAFDSESVEVRALDVLAQAYFAPTSRLHKELVLDRQWVDWLAAGAEDRRDPGFFLVLARVKDVEKVPDVRAAIERTLAEAGSETLAAGRLEQVTSRLRYGFLSGLQTPDDVAGVLCHYAQLTGATSTIDRSFDTLATVTAGDVSRAGARVFRPSNRTVVTLAPGAFESPA
jgi:zinc protease